MTTYTDEVSIYNAEAIQDGIDGAAETATNYITTVTNDGIMVADAGSGASSGSITSSTTGWHLGGVLEYIRNGISRFWIGLKNQNDTSPTVRIGKKYTSGATDNESHMELDYHSMQMVDKEGNVYLHASDLRNSSGYLDVVDTFIGDGESHIFYLSHSASTSSYTVLVDGVSATTSSKTSTEFILQIAPASGSNISVSYRTVSSWAKAYTFGKRANGNIGAHSFVEGRENLASGMFSHAEGYAGIASGPRSHSEGNDTKANGPNSHAQNSGTIASGLNSHAEGDCTVASGINSHAEGSETTASGRNSHASGSATTASGRNSHAEGEGTLAARRAQTAIGKYNAEDLRTETFTGDGATNIFTMAEQPGSWYYIWPTIDGVETRAFAYDKNTQRIAFDTAPESGAAIKVDYIIDEYGDYAMIVGNGTADNDRSNALTVDWEGTIESAGKIKADDSIGFCYSGGNRCTLNRSGDYLYITASDANGGGVGAYRFNMATWGIVFRPWENGAWGSWETHIWNSAASRNANTILAAPNGSAGAATFRTLVPSDCSWLGDRKVEDQSSNVEVANTTWVAIASVELTAGVWIINGNVTFSSNATGRRYACIHSASPTTAAQRQCGTNANATNGAQTVLNLAGSKTPTASTTYTLYAYQTSGSALNCTGYIAATRIK